MPDRYSIAVHGGIVTSSAHVNEAQLELIRSVVGQARERLSGGAAALDVVVDAVVSLEDSGLLNAGKGSTRNRAGFAETDACVMAGHTGKGGAVAAMQRIKNPIRAARIVMEKTPHVLLAGPAGEETLIALGAETVADPAAYFTPYRNPGSATSRAGTVGAVALDRHGHLAAATSTGGYVGKLPGRVGDSPIIGAGTFADERYAVSATGLGEYFVLHSVARDIAVRAQREGLPLQAAADFVMHRIIGTIGDEVDAAVIAISRDGEIVLSSANVLGERYGYASESRDVVVGVDLPVPAIGRQGADSLTNGGGEHA